LQALSAYIQDETLCTDLTFTSTDGASTLDINDEMISVNIKKV
jgi:hypothetical protein